MLEKNDTNTDLAIEKMDLDRNLDILLEESWLTVLPRSKSTACSILHQMIYQRAEHQFYYLRITETDFQDLLKELRVMATMNPFVAWEMLVYREGIGEMTIKIHDSQVYVELEIVGSEEESILIPTTKGLFLIEP